MTPSDTPDPYDHYRSLIAWSARMEREWPFYEAVLHGAPSRSLIDVGCGPGEHARYLASRGFSAWGLDRSENQIESAREYEGEFGEAGPRFLLGSMEDLESLTEERFGAALCVGNVLPSLNEDSLRAGLRALSARLLPGARLAVQLLNYERILRQGIRHLPLNFRPDPKHPDGEIVWLRLMRPDEDPEYLIFTPTTLRLLAGAETPVEIVDSREIRVRAWTWAQLKPLLSAVGFERLECFGDMARRPFFANDSHDLIFTGLWSP